MRRIFLAALMAGAMFAVAAPAASIAAKQTSCPSATTTSPTGDCVCRTNTSTTTGPTGDCVCRTNTSTTTGPTGDCVCPPGTDNPDYCVRGTPRQTAEACAVAGVAAADKITDTSTSVTFSFKATVTGECHFTLLFKDPGSGKKGHPIKYVIVGQAVIHTTAGLTSTVTVALNAVGLADIAHDAPGDLTQLFEVVAKQVTSTGSATVHVFGSFTLP